MHASLLIALKALDAGKTEAEIEKEVARIKKHGYIVKSGTFVCQPTN